MIRVQCHGVFDILHYGHLKHLQYAKSLGDVLIVTITADKFVNKGIGRPVFNQNERREMLQSHRCVDHVLIVNAPGAEPAIELADPHIYVKNKEWAGHLPEQAYCDRNGIKTVFYSFNDVHSSALVTRLLSQTD